MRSLLVLTLLAMATLAAAADNLKVEDLKSDAAGYALAAEMALSVKKGHGWTVWTRNLNRTTVPAGGTANPGDQVLAHGLIFPTAAATGTPIGSFQLAATVTEEAATYEERLVSIELAFYKNYTDSKHLQLRREVAAKAGLETADTDDLELEGMERYPPGGVILQQPLELAIVGGVGAYIGAKGQVKITVNNAAPGGAVFQYDLFLV